MAINRTALIGGIVVLPLVVGAVAAHPIAAAHPAAKTHARTYKVHMRPGTGKNKAHYYFVPSTLKIKAGDTVEWVDDTTMVHDVVGSNSAAHKYIHSSYFSKPKTYHVTFKKAGTYPYKCTIHLPTMVGRIVVAK